MTPDELVPKIYDELRRLAASKMKTESKDHTLTPTALVNEAWFKLKDSSFGSQSAFFRASAVAMRQVLIDHYRAKKADKRGGNNPRVHLDLNELGETNSELDFEALDSALVELAKENPEAAELVQLRFFAGMTVAAASEVLGISTGTAYKTWLYAKSWLFVKLSPK